MTITLRAKELLLFLLASLSLSLSADAAGHRNVVRRQFMGPSPRTGARLILLEHRGTDGSCNALTGPSCPPPQLNVCCGNQCRNVLADRNHCGVCGSRCGFGQLCCEGRCTSVAYDVANCGECGAVCAIGQRCEYGACGYA